MKKFLLLLFFSLSLFLFPVVSHADRVENVLPADPPEQNSESETTIYLTYDDGPADYTEELLELLDEFDAKATFFVVGKEIKDEPELVGKAYKLGHAIGMHSDAHDYNYLYSSEENFRDDLNSVREMIFDITGKYPTLYRFPGGSSTAFQIAENSIGGGFETLEKLLRESGIEYFDWDDSADSKGDSPLDSVYRIISSAEKRGSLVVIQHDTRGGCIPATRRLLELGLEKGISFKALDPSVEARHFH